MLHAILTVATSGVWLVVLLGYKVLTNSDAEEKLWLAKASVVVIGLVVAYQVIKALVQGASQMETVPAILAGLLCLVIAGALFFAWKWKSARELVQRESVARDAAADRANALMSIKLIVDQHAHTLVAQRNLLTSHDVYGNADDSGWREEMATFYKSTVAPRVDGASLSDVIAVIEERLARKAPAKGYITDNGHQFEQECLDAFKALGWEGYKTKGSGDQGADLVLNKAGISVVVQCKLYINKVGNSAIQQAHTAKSIYQTDYAAVITKTGYTSSALQAAKHTDVVLLTTGGEDQLEISVKMLGKVSSHYFSI